jgi:hypothetical protein
LPTSKTRLEALRRRTHGNSQIWSAMQTRVRRTGIPAATSAACALYGQVADRRCEADLSALICHLIRPNSLARKPTRSPRVRRGQPSTKAGRIFRIVASRFQWRCRLSGPNVKGAFSEWPTYTANLCPLCRRAEFASLSEDFGEPIRKAVEAASRRAIW